MTPTDLRTNFPEFASATDYPDGQIQFWLNMAGVQLNIAAWADLLDMGTQLYVAHHLVLGARDRKAAAVGGAPGGSSGPQASKSVDKVSVSYDTGTATIENAGNWNLTSYGTQFYQLMRMVGMGGRQL